MNVRRVVLCRRVIPIVVVLLALMSSAGCHNQLPPNATPQMGVAKYAGDAMVAVNQIQKITVGLVDSKVLPVERGATAMAASIKAGESGIQLSKLLQAYQVAVTVADKTQLTPQIAAVITEVNAFVASLPGLVGKSVVDSQYAKTIADLIAAIANIRVSIPALPPAAPQGEV